MRHNEIDELLRYVDGELPARAAVKVRSHLEACWQCRAECNQLENTVAQCVNYRKNFLRRYLPSPPAPWMDIYQGFAEIDTSMELGFFERLRRMLEWPVQDMRRWAVAAAVLLFIAGVFFKFRQTPSVQAAELLQKAVVMADSHPMNARRIEIRTKSHHLTRSLGSAARVNAADRAATESLEAMFASAHYDWNNPLSAKAFQDWRAQLADKRDTVASEQSNYVIRTGTDSGLLASASITLRAQDLSPVEERLEFRNQDWVQITALPEESSPAPGPLANSNVGRPAALPTAPARNADEAAVPVAAATVADELHAIATLHQLGADLGEPVEVSRDGGSVVVSGAGIAAPRQKEIADALRSQPHVIARFTDSPSIPPPSKAQSAADSSTGADVRQLQARIAQQVGGRVNFDQLAGQVLDLSESIMSRAYALRHLAEKFPTSAEADLPAADLQLLRTLQQEHASAMRRHVAEMDRMLRPVLAPVAGRISPDINASPTGSWQSATDELFDSSRQLEKLLAGMFGAAPLETANDKLPSQSLSILNRLRTKLDVYNELISKSSRTEK